MVTTTFRDPLTSVLKKHSSNQLQNQSYGGYCCQTLSSIQYIRLSLLIPIEAKSSQVYFDNPQTCQNPVISWPHQVRPCCLYVDKIVSTGTNIQRCCRPASEQNNKHSMFFVDKIDNQFSEPWKIPRFTFNSSFRIVLSSKGYSRMLVLDQSYHFGTIQSSGVFSRLFISEDLLVQWSSF